jgi:hypothetical protein
METSTTAQEARTMIDTHFKPGQRVLDTLNRDYWTVTKTSPVYVSPSGATSEPTDEYPANDELVELQAERQGHGPSETFFTNSDNDYYGQQQFVAVQS